MVEYSVPYSFLQDDRRDAREALDDVRKRLSVGVEGSGAMLTADECAKVLSCMKSSPNPNGRPPKDRYVMVLMAIYCRAAEDSGASLKSAIESTMRFWGCKRATVYRALKYFPSR
jgi:hypothetical protein